VPEGLFWPAWRLVLDGVATLEEIETHYSLDDVMSANLMLDLKHEAERLAREKAEAEQKRKAGR
jgi:ABC-type uncharacterized transport system substrate-binding protein